MESNSAVLLTLIVVLVAFVLVVLLLDRVVELIFVLVVPLVVAKVGDLTVVVVVLLVVERVGDLMLVLVVLVVERVAGGGGSSNAGALLSGCGLFAPAPANVPVVEALPPEPV